MKKKLIYLVIILIIIIALVMSWYFINLGSVKKNSEKVSFEIKTGTNVVTIIKMLEDANLIKDKNVANIYYKLNKNNFKKNIEAGTYELDRNMDLKEIFNVLTNGAKNENTVRLTFKEGYQLDDYADIISDNFNYSKEEIMNKFKDTEYVKKLINQYWFLTDDVLNDKIYYDLEGYIYPDTYEYYKDSTLEDIIKKPLDKMEKVLNEYKDKLNELDLSVHELLTKASIVEKESPNYRTQVAQVIDKRLELNMSLGMDVTSYYGAHKKFSDTLTKEDLNSNNPYNTRLLTFKGLPVGPICSPDKKSIDAVINPADTDYVYFYADIKTGTVYFTDSYNEFLVFKNKYGLE